MQNNEKYVLITGAGAGLGKCLAIEFAQKGYSVALASLLQNELDELKDELEHKYSNISVKVLAVDMLHNNAHTAILEWIDKEKIHLHGLVNNVGFGYAKAFEELTPDFVNNLLQINIAFTTKLTHILSARLIEKAPSFILNVASMAAYFPLPYKAIYSASKGFVLTFSQALRQEYKEKKVNVSCITPGPMITNDEVRDRIKKIGWRKYVTSIAEPEKVAAIAVKGVLNNKAVIRPTFSDKLNVVLKAIVPSFALPSILRRLSKNSF
jgi:hypothetical protein